MFAYTPLISGEWYEVLQIGGFALFGIYATNALIQFYAEGPLGIVSLPFLVLGSIGAYWPLNTLANSIGAILIIVAILVSKHALRNQTSLQKKSA